MSGYLDICAYLLSEGAEVNQADVDGWSVLHAASCYNHHNLIDLFIEHGAKIEQKTKDCETPLHIAVQGTIYYRKYNLLISFV
jgi:serine/threonine-protein phosphatase 6 regulatory ankyrin repeat subunit B